MSCKHKERNGARNDALNMENLKIDRGHVLRKEEIESEPSDEALHRNERLG